MDEPLALLQQGEPALERGATDDAIALFDRAANDTPLGRHVFHSRLEFA
jgi:hypothetical protein